MAVTCKVKHLDNQIIGNGIIASDTELICMMNDAISRNLIICQRGNTAVIPW